MGKHSKDVEEEAEMDLTPMIDCVFLLIIFFLCIEFKSLEAKLQAYLPKDKGSQQFKVEPQEQLSVRIEVAEKGTSIPRRPNQPTINEKTGRPNAVALIGHKAKYAIGPTPFRDLERMRKELEKIRHDPNSVVPDAMNPGKRKLLPVVIEPQPGTTYGDVAEVVDAIKSVGFEEINFGGGRGAAK